MEQEKWKRTVDALDTAINIYVEKGYLHNDKNVIVRAGAKLCTTDYKGDTLEDDELFNSESDVWEEDAVYPMLITFDLKKDHFNDPANELLTIKQNDVFYLRFDGTHKMWYTMDDPDDIVIPEMESEPFTAKELKTVEAEYVKDNGVTVKHLLKIPAYTEIRLKHGLFLNVDLANDAVVFTKDNLNRMKKSKDVEVVNFLIAYKDKLELFAGSSKNMGFYKSLKPEPQKTPLPCLAAWSLSQMFQTTPNLQQCVKVTVEAKSEYFFIMTERIADKHSWIYIHQQRDSLCIHRLDKNGREDELNVCADSLGDMDDLSDNTEMYVCTNYLKEEKKLRIQVGRPNYNSYNLESATIILSVSILIDELNHEGPPRYYAVASGQSRVLVRSLYVTNLDRVICTGKYTRAENPLSTGNYQSCDLACHEECAGGCNQPNLATSCMECKHHKFYYSESRYECIESCGTLPEIQYSEEPARFVNTGDITFGGDYYFTPN